MELKGNQKEYYVFSSGGGRQSSAALVLSANGILPYQHHIFCNTGDDSEDRNTLNWVREVLIPYANENKIRFDLVSKVGKTLYRTINETRYSIPIPAKFHYENGKKNIGMRACATEYKIRVHNKTVKNIYGSLENPPIVHVGLGISVDEIERAKTYPIRKMNSTEEVKGGGKFYWIKSQEYPLIFNEPFEIFGKQYKSGLTANDCSQIVEDSGLGTPPKSACWFCPYHSVSFWKQNAERGTEIFNKGVELENLLQEKESRMKDKHDKEGRPFNRFKVYLTDTQIPLSVINQHESKDEYEENCESGYCMV